jgi:hypothetical protein
VAFLIGNSSSPLQQSIIGSQEDVQAEPQSLSQTFEKINKLFADQDKPSHLFRMKGFCLRTQKTKTGFVKSPDFSNSEKDGELVSGVFDSSKKGRCSLSSLKSLILKGSLVSGEVFISRGITKEGNLPDLPELLELNEDKNKPGEHFFLSLTKDEQTAETLNQTLENYGEKHFKKTGLYINRLDPKKIKKESVEHIEYINNVTGSLLKNEGSVNEAGELDQIYDQIKAVNRIANQFFVDQAKQAELEMMACPKEMVEESQKMVNQTQVESVSSLEQVNQKTNEQESYVEVVEKSMNLKI